MRKHWAFILLAVVGAVLTALFVARLAQGTAAREGEPVELAVKTKRLHFFDPVTGAAIYSEH